MSYDMLFQDQKKVLCSFPTHFRNLEGSVWNNNCSGIYQEIILIIIVVVVVNNNNKWTLLGGISKNRIAYQKLNSSSSSPLYIPLFFLPFYSLLPQESRKPLEVKCKHMDLWWSMCLWFFIRNSVWETGGIKEQEKEARNIMINFLLEHDFGFQLRIFFFLWFFWVRLSPELLSWRLSYDSLSLKSLSMRLWNVVFMKFLTFSFEGFPSVSNRIKIIPKVSNPDKMKWPK